MTTIIHQLAGTPIDRLQRNGRIANNELADAVGLSPSPCLRRVRNLEASDIISSYVAILDRGQLATC